jgi:RimJ/RimL family protein N-acetyltransferase
MTRRVELRAVEDADLPLLFEQQLDPRAIHMAAFTHADPSDRAAFDRHWARIRADAAVTQRTILADGAVVGWVGSYGPPDEPEVTYWLGREYWGQGLATEALRLYLRVDTRRPIDGRAAADNAASLRVLEKCGFQRLGIERGFANARGQEIEEIKLVLRGEA